MVAAILIKSPMQTEVMDSLDEAVKLLSYALFSVLGSAWVCL